MWETPKTIFTYLQGLQISTTHEEIIHEGCLNHRVFVKEKKEDHARLPAQVPASRVSRNPDGNNRQERTDAVSGLKDGKHRTDNALARHQDRK